MFEKIKYFKLWKKSIKRNRLALLNELKLETDNAYRLYTVVNIPKDLIGDEYSLRTQDINAISESYIKEYTKEVSKYLDSIGLRQLYKYYKVEKVDKFSYLLVYGFSLFESDKYLLRKYALFYPLIISILITSLYILYKIF